MGYLRAGTTIVLACSCSAEVVMSLVLVGVHRHYTVRILTPGATCRESHHRRGARTVARQSHGAYTDALAFAVRMPPSRIPALH